MFHFPLYLFRFRITNRSLRDLGGLSMAIRGTVLYFQVLPVRNDVICFGVDYNVIHHRTLRRNMPSNQSSNIIKLVTCCENCVYHLDSLSFNCAALSDSHSGVSVCSCQRNSSLGFFTV